MSTIPSPFTIRQLSEAMGTEYLETGGFVRFAEQLDLIELAGEAPKSEKVKGKAPNLFRFKDGLLGRSLRQILLDAKNTAHLDGQVK